MRDAGRLTFFLFWFMIALLPEHCLAQQGTGALLDRLAGDWVLSGNIGGRHTTHDIHAEWVLNREYLRLHEISREKQPNGQPKYEAIVFISWDTKTHEYTCVWLDSTAGGGLSGPIAHAKEQPSSIPLVFTFSDTHALHNTFAYNPKSDTWSSTITDVDNGKEDRFADVVLTRRRTAGL